MEAKTVACYLKIPTGVVEEIRKTYNLDEPERLAEAINILFDWIQKQDHIIKKDFSRDYLEKTVMTCKGSVEKAKKQIDRLCTMKTLLPKYFTKTNVKLELPNILEIAWVIPLPKLTEDYYRVLLIKFRHVKSITDEMFLEYLQFNIILSEYFKANEYAHGFIVLHDFRDLNLLDLITKLNTVELQQFLTILMKGYGARIKSLNYLTESKIVELLINLTKQVVSAKLSNRLHVQKTINDLHKIVPKNVLPKEYGGDEKSISELKEELIAELSTQKYVEYMKMMNNACSDETKRHDGQFNEEYLGMPGTFRCLSVD